MELLSNVVFRIKYFMNTSLLLSFHNNLNILRLDFLKSQIIVTIFLVSDLQLLF